MKRFHEVEALKMMINCYSEVQLVNKVRTYRKAFRRKKSETSNRKRVGKSKKLK